MDLHRRVTGGRRGARLRLAGPREKALHCGARLDWQRGCKRAKGPMDDVSGCNVEACREGACGNPIAIMNL